MLTIRTQTDVGGNEKEGSANSFAYAASTAAAAWSCCEWLPLGSAHRPGYHLYPRANETMTQAIAGVGPMTGLIASNAQRCRSDPKPVPCAGFVASGVVAFREIEKPTK